MGLDVTQSFENGPDCGGFTLATHAKYVLAPGLDIEPEICKVYSLEVAGFFILLNFFLKRLFLVCVLNVSFGWRNYLIKQSLWLFIFRF